MAHVTLNLKSTWKMELNEPETVWSKCPGEQNCVFCIVTGFIRNNYHSKYVFLVMYKDFHEIRRE